MAAENSIFSHRQQENWWECHESEEADGTSMSEGDDNLERFLEELDVKGHEMVEKLVVMVENDDVPFEQVFRKTWHHFRGKHSSEMLEKNIARKMRRERDVGNLVRGERGVDGDSLQEELKNERFKVKTLNIIKEEVAGK